MHRPEYLLESVETRWVGKKLEESGVRKHRILHELRCLLRRKRRKSQLGYRQESIEREWKRKWVEVGE